MSPEEAATFVKKCEKKFANPNEKENNEVWRRKEKKQYNVFMQYVQYNVAHYHDYFLFSPKSFQSFT